MAPPTRRKGNTTQRVPLACSGLGCTRRFSFPRWNQTVNTGGDNLLATIFQCPPCVTSHLYPKLLLFSLGLSSSPEIRLAPSHTPKTNQPTKDAILTITAVPPKKPGVVCVCPKLWREALKPRTRGSSHQGLAGSFNAPVPSFNNLSCSQIAGLTPTGDEMAVTS